MLVNRMRSCSASTVRTAPLYDLDSAGGTSINGYPVEECVLHCGDVISFAGVSVIYGEDPPTPVPQSASERENTPAFPSPSSDAAAE